MGFKGIFSCILRCCASSKRTPSHVRSSKGFTLIELSIVMTIVGLMFAGAMMGVPMFLNKVKQQETTQKIDVVMNSLSSYVQRHNRLPCPADPAAAGAARGTEKDGGGCFQGADAATLMDNMQGLVPWRELGISERDAMDAWGKYLTYRPAPHLTVNNFAASMQDGAGADIHNACRSPVWYNAEGQHLDRAKALFVCNAQPTTSYLDIANAALATDAEVAAWKNVALGVAGTDLGLGANVMASNRWRDSYTAEDAGSNLLYAGAFSESLSGMADSPLGRATSTAVTIISHGGNNMFSFLRDGNRQQDTAGGDFDEERKNVDSMSTYMGNVASPKSAVIRGGNIKDAGRAARGLDDIVVALRSDQLYAKVGGPTVSAIRPATSGEDSGQDEPPVAADCNGIASWTVGADTCTENATLTHGSTSTYTDSAGPTLGTADITCDFGSFVASNATCVSQCMTGDLTWLGADGLTDCTATFPTTDLNDTATATDSAAPATGTATYLCDNGVWTLQAGATCVTTCAAETKQWVVGGNTCEANLVAASAGTTSTATDSAVPTLGTADYSCTAITGVWQNVNSFSNTCATSCLAGSTVSWTDGATGRSCSADIPADIAHGASGPVLTDSIGPDIGSSSTVTCTNGTLNATGTCARQCNAGAVTWDVGGEICAGSIASGANNGVDSSLLTDATPAATGTATFTCSNGTWAVKAGAVCNPGCEGGPITWSVGGNTCDAAIPSAINDASSVATDSAVPTTGSATFVCQGTCFVQQPGATCNVAVNGACAAFGSYYGSQPGTSTATGCTAGTYADVANSSSQWSWTCVGAFGGTTATCNANKNQCSGATSWTVGANTCNGTALTTNSGSNTAAISDSTQPTTGSSTFACANGVLTVNGGATCVAQCAAQAVNWTVSGTCNGAAPTTNHGASTAVLTDSTLPTTGTASFNCNNGVLSVAGGAACVTAVNGACAAFGSNYGSQPGTNTATGCTAGTYADSGDTSSQWGWTCNGANGGTNATCTANKAQCSGAVSWTAGGDTCSGTALTTNSGANTATITDSTGTTGSSTFACANGTLTVNGGATCYANCPAEAGKAWTDDFVAFCAANVPARTHGQTTAVLTDPAPGEEGTIQWTCNDGTWDPVAGWECHIDGDCKAYGSTYASEPATNNATGCDYGTFTDLSDNATQWRWRCDGVSGGANSAVCTAAKPAVCTGYSYGGYCYFMVGSGTCNSQCSGMGKTCNAAGMAAVNNDTACNVVANATWYLAGPIFQSGTCPQAYGCVAYSTGGNVNQTGYSFGGAGTCAESMPGTMGYSGHICACD